MAQQAVVQKTNNGGTIASLIYERMRRDILDGQLKPGEKLPMHVLRERYEVSGSPIREALNRLSSDYLVVREDLKGFRVRAVNKTELLQLIKTRCWVEEIALRESILHGDREWEERVVLSFHHLKKIPGNSQNQAYKETETWEQTHRDFHLALIAACDSSWLYDFCTQLFDQWERYRRFAAAVIYPESHDRCELAEHQAIFDAVVNRDSATATEILMAHYRKTGEIALDFYNKFEA
jgi:DNA-binding GntR family transcriptional regulator